MALPIDEWPAPPSPARLKRQHDLQQVVVNAEQGLLARCRQLLTPPVMEDAAVSKWFIEQVASIEQATQALVRAEADRDDA